jgi:alkyl hydroperoxide reductase subunit AhpC
MAAYKADLANFAAYDAQVVGISVDSIYSTTAWEREIGPLDYALAADYWPHGEVAQKFGVFRDRGEFAGISERALFVVDKAVKIAFSKVYPIEGLPDTAELFTALEKLK